MLTWIFLVVSSLASFFLYFISLYHFQRPLLALFLSIVPPAGLFLLGKVPFWFLLLYLLISWLITRPMENAYFGGGKW